MWVQPSLAAIPSPAIDPTRHEGFEVAFARDEDEVRAAQRLRYRVFAEEMGARLKGPAPGIDADHFDPYCEHLIVRERSSGEVVGTYRLLSPSAAKRLGGYYTEEEFDLVRLRVIRPYLVEVGRSCVHPDYRNGPVIFLLWAGLAEYMLSTGYKYLIGCASIPMRDGGRNASAVWHAVKDKHLSPEEWRVFPRQPLALDPNADAHAAQVPPLIKGYLRLGAWVAGAPAWDPDFNTADLPILLATYHLNRSYARHFLKRR